MEIKLATKDDFELFAPIKIEFNKNYKIPEKPREFILDEFNDYLKDGIIVIALIKGQIVGYLLGIIEGDRYERFGHIGEVFVSNNFRGKGISTKLKDKFIEYLKVKNIESCKIYVNQDNLALEIYKKWGFKIDKFRLSLKL